jgi:hypothetical protein
LQLLRPPTFVDEEQKFVGIDQMGKLLSWGRRGGCYDDVRTKLKTLV